MIIAPLVKAMIHAAEQSVGDLRATISDVRHGGFSPCYSYELIEFSVNPSPTVKPEMVGSYVGTIKGRNSELALGYHPDADRAIALRVWLDGDATKIANIRLRE